MENCIEIDGSQGEGGGQILRSSLTLSALTKKSVRVRNIRAGRAKPGLLRQHLAVVRALGEIAGAHVDGAEMGSGEVLFIPGKYKAGSYEFGIGSAGSTTLLFQSILPVLAMADGPSSVQLMGGTHNGMAPSVDYVEQVFLPRIRQIGFNVTSELKTYGFYPNGGGVWQLAIDPMTESRSILLLERGDLVSKSATATNSKIELHVAERQLATIGRKLGCEADDLQINQVGSPGPGNILSVRAEYGHGVELFEAVAEVRVSVEKVAIKAANAFRKYDSCGAAVSEYMADQLLLPMVVGAGGEFTTRELSKHTLTNIDVINHLLGETKISTYERESDVLIKVLPISA